MSDLNGGNIKNPTAGLVVTPSRAEAVMSKIQSQMEGIKDIISQVTALIEELQAQRAAKPEKPNTAGMKSEAAAAVMARFNEALSKWQEQLNKLNERLQQMQEKLHDAEATLQKLQNVELPAAEAKDRDDLRRQVEDQQKALKDAAESLATSKEDRLDKKPGEDASGKQLEIRALMVKRDTKFGLKEFVTLVIGQPPANPPPGAEEVTGAKIPKTPARDI